MAKMRTYEGWLEKGRHVRRGEKAKDRDDFGRALFSKKQTDKVDLLQQAIRENQRSFNHWDREEDYMLDYGSLGDIH